MAMNININSLLQRLRNKAIESDLSVQLTLQLFCQEEFLRRLSISKYRESFILKGGLLIYLVTNLNSRPTMDIDFLMRNISNELENIRSVIEHIVAIETGNEFVKLKIRSLEPISEQKKYHGMRIKMLGIIGNTKTPFDVDLGIGDVVVPRPRSIALDPLLKDYRPVELVTYSFESIIAEKWDAIVDKLALNSRMKDFYDIYFLANNYDFEGAKIQKAIFETFLNRNRVFDKSKLTAVALLAKDQDFVARWDIFIKKSMLLNLSFTQVTNFVLGFVEMPVISILDKSDFTKKWSKKEKQWF